MSRIGNNPIKIPKGVSVSITPEQINVKGKMGELTQSYDGVSLEQVENTLVVKRNSDTKTIRAKHGLYRSLIANMVQGVNQGFTKELELVGVGYQANSKGNRLHLQLGFSHDIYFDMPEGISIIANRTEIKVEGIDKQLVGAVSAKIRSFRPPEPYKGKGIRFVGEEIRRKAGKTAAK